MNVKNVLINKNFRTMWIWELITLLNGKFRQIIIPLLILSVTNSPLATSVVSVAQMIAGLVFVIPTSTWVENKNKVKTAGTFRALYGLGLFTLAFILTLDGLNLVLLTSVMIVMQLFQLISSNAFSVMIPKIAGRENLLQAHTSIEAAESIATLLGPALGGYLLGNAGAVIGLIVCGSLSLLATGFIFLLDYEEETEENKEVKKLTTKTKKFYGNALAGFHYLKANPQQLISTVTASILNFSTVFIELALIFYVRMSLGFSEESVGILLSSAGVGTIIGLFIIKYFEKMNWVKVFGILLLISGSGVGLLSLTNHFIIMCIGMALFDCACSMAFVMQGTVHQGISPDDYLSRINGAYYLVGGVFSIIGTLLAGVLPELIAGRMALIIGMLVLIIPATILLQMTRYGVETNKIEPIYLEE